MKTIIRCGGLLVAGLALALCPAGCPLSFEATLPANVDAALSVVLDKPDDFAQPASGSVTVTAGTVMAPLTGVVGCWGSFVAAIAGQGSLGQMDSYSVLQLRADGTFTTWDVENLGGFAAVVSGTSGHYEVEGDNRVRFTTEQRQYYDPVRKSFNTEEVNPPQVGESLATVDGNTLYLAGLDDQGAGQADYTQIYQRFECPQ
jgi:hypothetical protein